MNWEGVYHFDGLRWSEFLARESYLALSALAPNDVWATSDWGRVRHFDGKTWSVSHETAQKLGAVFARSPDDVWAGGGDGILLHYDGRAWSEEKSGAGYWIYEIWASGPNDVWVAGDRAVLHFDGSSWKPVPFPESSQRWRVWGSAPDDVWVTSYFSNPAHHFDGARWADFPTGVPKGLIEDLWGTDRTHYWATGCEGVVRWDGSKWSPIDVGKKLPMTCIGGDSSVRGTADDDLWFVLSLDSIQHWDGQKVSCSVFPYDVFALGGTPDDLWAVGGYGIILHRE